MTARENILQSYQRISEHGLRPAWIELVPQEEALARADAVDPSLPLAGLTFAVKDNIDVAGVPTTAGCPAYAYTPSRSATVVRLLQEAGAIAIGKTNLDQFATGLVGVRSPYGACSSVYDSAYISGGSSSGSAVSVARGEVDFALGTDTAGSGRVPAAFNNLIGLKPTRGVFSMTGVVPACRTLDCISVLARDVNTAERVFRIAAQPDPEDWSARGFHPPAVDWTKGRFRFGAPSAEQLEFFGDAESARLFDEAVAILEDTGGIRVNIDFAPFREAASLLYAGPWVAERLAAIEEFLKGNADAVYPVTRQIIGGAEKLTAVETFRAMYRLGQLRRATDPEWAKMDVLLLPTTGTIYRIDEVAAEPVKLNTNLGYYTNFVNLLDLAAIAIPAGFRKNGTPFGVSLIGPAMSDAALCMLGSRIGNEAESARRAIAVAVVGAHLTGQPLNHQLTDRRARLLKTCRTAPRYRLFALANTTPPKPGLVREEGFAGPGIELEVWSMPEREFGGFVGAIPAPLGIGAVVLDDGSTVRGFICEPAGLSGALEITHLGGWRNYLATR